MNNKKILTALILIVVAAALLFLGKYLVDKNKEDGGTNTDGVEEVIEAPAGQTVEGYAGGLILPDTQGVEQSYSVKNENGSVQKTAVFVSGSSISQVYDQYMKLLTDNKFVIVNKSVNETAANIYAMKIAAQGTFDVNVVVVKDDVTQKTTYSVTTLEKSNQ